MQVGVRGVMQVDWNLVLICTMPFVLIVALAKYWFLSP